MQFKSSIFALMAFLAVGAVTAPVLGVTAISGVRAPTVAENHEGGIVAEDYVNGVAPVSRRSNGVTAISGVRAPTVAENHEGGIVAEDYVNGVAPAL